LRNNVFQFSIIKAVLECTWATEFYWHGATRIHLLYILHSIITWICSFGCCALESEYWAKRFPLSSLETCFSDHAHCKHIVLHEHIYKCVKYSIWYNCLYSNCNVYTENIVGGNCPPLVSRRENSCHHVLIKDLNMRGMWR